MGEAERAVWQLPPATDRQAWYGVVRLELGAKSAVAKVASGRVPVVCMVQMLDVEYDHVNCWGMKIAKTVLTKPVTEAMESLQAKMRALGPSGAFCKNGGPMM